LQTANEVRNHELTTVDISTIVFDETNPNKLNAKQMEGLRQSMLEYGYLTPVIIDQNNVVADGEHRALVYKQLGYTQIPVIKLNLATDTKRKMLRQVMNKLHGEHDQQLDSNELLEIFQANKLTDLSTLIGQQQSDLEKAISKFHPEIQFYQKEDFDFNKTLEEIVPSTKLGDLYQLGEHRLICADCSDKRSISKLLEDAKVDLVFTDPPYNVDFDYNTHKDDLKPEEYEEFCKTWFTILTELSDRIIITPGPKNVGHWYNIQQPTDIATWYKPNSSTWATLFYKRCCEPILFYGEGFTTFLKEERNNKRRVTDLYQQVRILDKLEREARSDLKVTRFAPEKPVELIKELITEYSNHGQSILDIFIGSGTTIVAAEQTHRKCYGVEIDPMYCDVIIKRWEKYTDKKAEKYAM
jgi:DNA modification methylase